jgi:hypothetical protein
MSDEKHVAKQQQEAHSDLLKGKLLENSDTENCSVFISYSRRDKNFVKDMHDALKLDDRVIW